MTHTTILSAGKQKWALACFVYIPHLFNYHQCHLIRSHKTQGHMYYITSMKDVSGFKLQHPGVCSTWGWSHINRIHPEYVGYKCFVSLVTKQMTSTWLLPCVMSCKGVLLASQFKLSLAAVAGFVALFTHCQAIQLSAMMNFVILNQRTQPRIKN